MFGIVAGPSDSKWRRFHIQAQPRNLHTKFQLNRLKYSEIGTPNIHEYNQKTYNGREIFKFSKTVQQLNIFVNVMK